MTKRFSRTAAFAFFALVAACATLPAQAQTPPSSAAKVEPTYTLIYPGPLAYKLRVRVEPTADGGQTVFVQSPPRPAGSTTAPAFPTQFFTTDARLVVDREGIAQWSRFAFGPTPSEGIQMEATLQPGANAYRVGIPETRGVIPFTERLIHPFALQLFAGKLYDWTKGGAQTFAYFFAPSDTTLVRIVTLTLTAPNGTKTEPMALENETVPVRKLHASLALPFMPTQATQTKQRDLRIGPGGEVLQFDKDFFDVPFAVKSRAVWETPTRFILPFVRPGSASPLARLILRADKLGTAQKPLWDIGLDLGETRSPRTFGHVRCDANLSLTEGETPGRDRVCRVQVSGGQVRWQWQTDTALKNPSAARSGRTWWYPSWFATFVWEGPGMPFADLAAGEKRAGDYFPLFTGQRHADPFTLERLPDTSAPMGGATPVHHYRFVGKDAYDVYTDGKWLIAQLSSDKSTLIRDGWEAWAKTLPVPAPPTPEEKPAGTKAP